MRTWMFAPAFALLAMSAQAADYTIDPEHTRVTFEISHFGFSTFRGQFSQASGRVAYDPAGKTGSVEVAFPVASASTLHEDLDKHLQTADFFDAASHPNVTFRSRAMNFEGEKLKSVDGDLTMRGKTRPVRLTVTAVNCGAHPIRKVPVCGADAEVKLKRSEFGVSGYVPAIGDEVRLLVSVEAHGKAKAGGQQ